MSDESDEIIPDVDAPPLREKPPSPAPKKGRVGRPKSNRTDLIVPQLGILLEPTNHGSTQDNLGNRYVMELEYDCTVLIGKVFELVEKIGTGAIKFYFTTTGVDILVCISGDTKGMADTSTLPGHMYIRLDGCKANAYYIHKPFSISIDIQVIAKRIVNSAKHYNSIKFSITADELISAKSKMQIRFNYLKIDSYDLTDIPFARISQPAPDYLDKFYHIQAYSLRFQATVAYLKTVIISAQSPMIKSIKFYYRDGCFTIEHIHENQNTDKHTHFNNLSAINFVLDDYEDAIIACTFEHKSIINILNKDISNMAYLSIENNKPMGIQFNLEQATQHDPNTKAKFYVKNSEKIRVICLLDQAKKDTK